MALRDNLRKHRERSCKSLQQVADDVGASKAHIWELETGRAKNPSIELLTKLAKTFDVSVSDLIDENQERPTTFLSSSRSIANSKSYRRRIEGQSRT